MLSLALHNEPASFKIEPARFKSESARFKRADSLFKIEPATLL